MSVDRQDQRVGENAQAYQSGRDTIVHVGLTTEQMSEILVHVGKQMAFYAAEGAKKAEERIASFCQEVLKEFAPGKGGNADAFRDPDFQWLLGDTQAAYARSGDKIVRDTLVDIIAQRSQETTHSRLAITLNDAATTASQLTSEEFALLSLVFLFRYTKWPTTTPHEAVAFLETHIFPFIDDVSKSNSTYAHLQAKACGSLDVRQIAAIEIITNYYGGVLTKGITRQDIVAILPGRESSFDRLLIDIPGSEQRLRLSLGARDDFLEVANASSLPAADANSIWQMVASAHPTIDELCAQYYALAPRLRKLCQVWNESSVKHLTLTTLGMAIAHANARRVLKFAPPLSVWVN